MKNKPLIIAAGGLVLNEKNELLMIHRRGKWDLPKGKLDKGESIEQCAVREVEEETGLRNIRLGQLIGIGYHEYFDKYLGEDVIKESHWYAMTADSTQPLIPQTEEDIADIRWVKDAELRKCLENTYPNILDIVEKARVEGLVD
ncbi:NUDIX hydrolase [Sediminibacterium soli]|uniref:NUDIX hydrolase n=1 Tax=Sediminibacterium soli TaxID=2698829 RepID=UPI00137B7735|nr:NUDIX hydrolase [Sediminibacterium soli]NCI46344.1 NUDIX hydrolase [Sediminibacterium soli]